jgi:hypothetical protein
MMTSIERKMTRKEAVVEYLWYFSNIWLEVLRETLHSILQDSSSLHQDEHSTPIHMNI